MNQIHDVEVLDLQVNADVRGHLVEVFRDVWDEFDPDPEMSYYSMTYPGIIRAWHRHLDGQVDHFVCPKGRIKIGIYDDCEGSPTQGGLDTFVIGKYDQQVVRVSVDCWHGFMAIDQELMLILNSRQEVVHEYTPVVLNTPSPGTGDLYT